MVTFLVSIVILIIGYFTYGKFIDKTFGVDETRITPAMKKTDGVDFVPMSSKKVYLIQFLNIAGLGPIFGPILGALYGPAAFVWIVLGAIFAGGVHDYFSGMISVRNDGKSVPELTGKYLGDKSKYAMFIISFFLLLFVGIVFVVGPAKLLANLTFEENGASIFTGSIFANINVWVIIIFIYYFISTIIPIDKVIGKIYPLFGAVLMFMAFGVGGAMLYHGLDIPELTSWADITHPNGTPLWPGLVFTISCGAISGFHSTQSPLMARTIRNEKFGKKVFYGAMITEAIVAMIWAAVSMAYFPNGISGLNEIIQKGSPSLVVNQISIGYLGIFGGLLAIIGVIVAPITSGDTSFRSLRLIIADRFNIPQKSILNRLYITLPLFILAYFITKVDFSVIWTYFTFSNQLLAAFTLWMATAYLYKNKKTIWTCAIPAIFMSSSIVGYIPTAKEFGLMLNPSISYILGISTSILLFIYVLILHNKQLKE